ncbi:MAG: hypothetical protein M3O34_11620, partial [Chloroflexota bacterium]|nr:hypothetical protein [Chloroflexota bacterium]
MAALVLVGVTLCAVALMMGASGPARAQTPPPIVPTLPGSTYQPLPISPTPIRTPLVVPTLRPPAGEPAPVVIVTPTPPTVRVTPAVPVVVVTP